MASVQAQTKQLRRRSGAAGAPTNLLAGQFFHNEPEKVVYIGKGDDGAGNSTSQVAIGGAGAFVDQASDQSIAGRKTFTDLVKFGTVAGAATSFMTTDGHIGMGGKNNPVNAFLYVGKGSGKLLDNAPGDGSMGVKVLLDCVNDGVVDGGQFDVAIPAVKTDVAQSDPAYMGVNGARGTLNALLGRAECFHRGVAADNTAANYGGIIGGRFDTIFDKGSSGTDRDSWGGHIQSRLADNVDVTVTPNGSNPPICTGFGTFSGAHVGCEISLQNFSAGEINGHILHLGTHGVSKIKSALYITCGGYPSEDGLNCINVTRNNILMPDDTKVGSRQGRGPSDNYIWAGPCQDDGTPTGVPKFQVDAAGKTSATSFYIAGASDPIVPTGTPSAFTTAPAITFVTPGDLSVSYTTATGTTYKVGKLVYVNINLVFTPTYSTTGGSAASGAFRVLNLPYAASGASALAVTQFSGTTAVTWPASGTALQSVTTSGQTYLLVQGVKSGSVPTNASTTNVASGNTITLNINGWYLSA